MRELEEVLPVKTRRTACDENDFDTNKINSTQDISPPSIHLIHATQDSDNTQTSDDIIHAKRNEIPPHFSKTAIQRCLTMPSFSSTATSFNFNRFMSQLRHRSADPVVRYLRSFLVDFCKRQWMVREQVVHVHTFFEFIGRVMAKCDVWRNLDPIELSLAHEGMEKLVTTRLFERIFSPAIPSPDSTTTWTSEASYTRKGQHQDDVERDRVIAQKIRIYGWTSERHLDIPEISTTNGGSVYMKMAENYLNEVNSYRAPRDKVICILNCCKIIYGYLRRFNIDQSADSFLPHLIYVVLRANPEHLVSNVQYILRFRSPEHMNGEAGYYTSSLVGAVQFIEKLDKTSLNVSDEEFERNVECAVSAIAERDNIDSRHEIVHHNHLQFETNDEISSNGTSVSNENNKNEISESGNCTYSSVLQHNTFSIDHTYSNSTSPVRSSFEATRFSGYRSSGDAESIDISSLESDIAQNGHGHTIQKTPRSRITRVKRSLTGSSSNSTLKLGLGLRSALGYDIPNSEELIPLDRETIDQGKGLIPDTIENSDRFIHENRGLPLPGLLKTIQRPLSTIGRVFSSEEGNLSTTILNNAEAGATAIRQFLPRRIVSQQTMGEVKSRLANFRDSTKRATGEDESSSRQSDVSDARPRLRRLSEPSETIYHEDDDDYPGRIERNHQRINSVETGAISTNNSISMPTPTSTNSNLLPYDISSLIDRISNIFPGLDREVIGDVICAQKGSIGPVVDTCLALSDN